MKAKLAFRNLRKSFREYSIYFMTIAISVAIFYVYNAIPDLEKAVPLLHWQRMSLQMTIGVIYFISWFCVVVMAFLILYANNYLLKHRSKEFGIYLLLGIENKDIAMMIFMETISIGILAFAAGIFLGVLFSQLGIIALMNFLHVENPSFKFFFSMSSMTYTGIYFVAIFALTLVWNIVRSYRYTLIQLLQIGKKNEKLVKIGKFGNVLLTFLGMGLLAYAYYLINHSKFVMVHGDFSKSIVFGFVGTLIFFRGLAGTLQVFAKKFSYYKNLNLFTIRQLSHDIRSAYLSMGIISILLLISLGSLITGKGLTQGMNRSKQKIFYDYSYVLSMEGSRVGEVDKDLGKVVQDKDFDLKKKTQEYDLLEYYTDQNQMNKDVIRGLSEKMMEEENMGGLSLVGYTNVKIISYQDYVNSQKKLGKDPLPLEKGQAILLTNYPLLQEFLDQAPRKIKFFKQEFKLVGWDEISISNDTFVANAFYVVDDETWKDVKTNGVVLNVNWKDGENVEENNKKLDQILHDYMATYAHVPDKELLFFENTFTEDMILQNQMETTLMVVLVTTFLGLMFVLFSSAVLALQQLSRQEEDRKRYRVLTILGADKAMMKHALFKQIAIYFFIPMFLGMVHTVAGIHAFFQGMGALGGAVDKMHASLSMSGLIFGIYLIYFFLTYTYAKRILEE